MATSAQRIADLERQVADLAGEVKNLREQAICLYTLEEMWIRHRMAGDLPGSPGSSRPRHLAAIQGGQG